MKRFSRKSKKNIAKNTSAGFGDADGKPSSPGEKSKSSLIKGWRKKLHRTSSTSRYPEEHVYATAPSVCNFLPSSTTSSNNSNTANGHGQANGHMTQNVQRSRSFEMDDHDYSQVANGETDAQNEPSPSVPERPNISGDSVGHAYSSITQQLPPRNPVHRTQNTTVPSCPSTSLIETANSNNSNDFEAASRTCSNNTPMKTIVQKTNPSSSRSNDFSSHPLTQEFHKLARKGWYWGPLSREEAEKKLRNLPEASFLVRDSSDDRYLLSLSFRSNNRTLHTRIEHSGFKFSFYEDSPSQWYTSVVDLIENSMRDSNEQGVFCYSRSRHPNAQTFPVRLMHPVSRFMEVRSLQDLCRFVIRQSTRIDHIQNLPVPKQIKGYLNQSYF